MAFKALDVAKYIVDYCTRSNMPVSNLKLQKILYYLWIDYYNAKNEALFIENICAWQFGPVVPDVYYEFCSYAGTPISKKYDELELSNLNIVDILNKMIDKYIGISPTELVNMSHEIGRPWDRIYKNGLGYREIIPFDLIVQLECNY